MQATKLLAVFALYESEAQAVDSFSASAASAMGASAAIPATAD
jgi:hypothetical protein